MKWRFEFTARALEQFQDLEPDLRQRIREKLGFWQSQENPLIFVRPTPSFKSVSHRYRIGKYRVIVRAESVPHTLVIVKIGPRDKVYQLVP